MPAITIGILRTDDVRKELTPEFGEYPEMFSKLLTAADATIKTKIYYVMAGEYPADIDEVDAYLITGSKFSVYDDEPWIARLSDFVKTLHSRKKALIGICFGHHLIHHVLGGATTKSDKGWGVGAQRYALSDAATEMGFTTDDGGFSLPVSHQDQVSTLATGAQVLAGNDFCPFAMSVLDNHILTFQGHPEFQREYARRLFALRRESLGDTMYQQALLSLEKEPERALVATWIVNFIKQRLR